MTKRKTILTVMMSGLILSLIGYILISIFTYADPEDILLRNLTGFNDFAKTIEKESIRFSYDFVYPDFVRLYANDMDPEYTEIRISDLGKNDKQKLDNLMKEMDTLGIQGFKYLGTGDFIIHFGDVYYILLYIKQKKRETKDLTYVFSYITGSWYLERMRK